MNCSPENKTEYPILLEKLWILIIKCIDIKGLDWMDFFFLLIFDLAFLFTM